MTLIFEMRRAYGRTRFYPRTAAAVAICATSGRAFLKDNDLLNLEVGGFTIRVDHGPVENIDWRPREARENDEK